MGLKISYVSICPTLVSSSCEVDDVNPSMKGLKLI